MANKMLLKIFTLLAVVTISRCNDNLRVAYQWKEIDFEYQSSADRQKALETKAFIPENVMPVGLEVYQNRLFITLPRWKTGVPASLAYIDINGIKKIYLLNYVIFFIYYFFFTMNRFIRFVVKLI